MSLKTLKKQKAISLLEYAKSDIEAVLDDLSEYDLDEVNRAYSEQAMRWLKEAHEIITGRQ